MDVMKYHRAARGLEQSAISAATAPGHESVGGLFRTEAFTEAEIQWTLPGGAGSLARGSQSVGHDSSESLFGGSA